MVDSLESAVKKAIKDKVLVLKVVSGEEIFYKQNPSLADVREAFSRELTLTFRKVWRPEDTERKYRYMMGWHIRGSSVHVDFRHQIGKGLVTGETIAVPFGVPDDVMNKLEEEVERASKQVLGKALQKKEDWANVSDKDKLKIRDKLNIKAEDFSKPLLDKFWPIFLDWNRKKVFVPKALQDTSWFDLPVTCVPPGFIGATDYAWALLIPFDNGDVEYCCIKPDYTELFLYSDHGLFCGKLVLTWLPREKVELSLPDDTDKLGDELWVGFIFPTKNQIPYVLTKRAIDDDYIPPRHVSALPKHVRDLIPDEMKYWHDASEDQRKRKRQELVAWVENNLEFYERKDSSDIPQKNQLVRKRKS